MTTEEMDPRELRGIVGKIQKLLKLAEKAGTEAEAASATAKAQEMLAMYNLDMAAVGQDAESGKREEQKQKGGMYVYERELWETVAELNFCLCFRSQVAVKRRFAKRTRWGTEPVADHTVFQNVNRVVGRTVNVQSTVAMAGYLRDTIERLCRERIADDGGKPQSQFFSSWAVAYREGMSERLCEKLRERRRAMVAEERRREEEARARAAQSAMAGASTATALTLGSLAKSERDANMDFLHGEGWSARQAQRRAERAEAQRKADEEYTRWAKENPDEARKQEEKWRKEEAKWERRYSRSSERYTARDSRRDSGAFRAGYERAESVSLEPQVRSRGDERQITDKRGE